MIEFLVGLCIFIVGFLIGESLGLKKERRRNK